MTTITQPLTSWLLDQIAADEAVARVFVNDLGYARPWIAAEVGGVVSSPGSGLAGDDGLIAAATTHADAAHIARHDPARVLAQCVAHRRIVELHRGFGLDDYPVTASCGECGMDSPCPTLCILAAAYSDHPGYREEWRP